MTVRAKFRVNSKLPGYNNEGFVIGMSAVSSGSTENEEFFRYTPSADLRLQTINEEAAKNFEVGDEFYIDFVKA